jgi:hypothetical protein
MAIVSVMKRFIKMYFFDNILAHSPYLLSHSLYENLADKVSWIKINESCKRQMISEPVDKSYLHLFHRKATSIPSYQEFDFCSNQQPPHYLLMQLRLQTKCQVELIATTSFFHAYHFYLNKFIPGTSTSYEA